MLKKIFPILLLMIFLFYSSDLVVQSTYQSSNQFLKDDYFIPILIPLETKKPELINWESFQIPADIITLGENRTQQRIVPTPTPTATPEPTSFAWPVLGKNSISQYFHRGHYGIDIMAKRGLPVIAVLGGTVISAGWKNNGGGYQIYLSHGNNLYTGYYHLSAILVGIGQVVTREQQIGKIGATGNATGPHLHFAVWIGRNIRSNRINPLQYY